LGKQNARNSQFSAFERVMKGHQQWEFPVEVFSHNKNLGLLMHEHEFNMDKGLVSQKAAPPYKKFCKLNHYTRDQNYRKYLAYRERRGVDLFTGKPK
jgi:hypothetical protein